MSALDRYKTSKALESEGVWVDFGDGMEFKLTRLNEDNKKAREVRKQLERPYRNWKRDDIPDDKQREFTTLTMAHAIIVDWKGVEYNGAPLPFSPENAIKLMNEFPDLRNDLIMCALERDTFKEQIAKNSASA